MHCREDVIKNADITYTIQTPITSNVWPYHAASGSMRMKKKELQGCSSRKGYKSKFLKVDYLDYRDDKYGHDEYDETDDDEDNDDDASLKDKRSEGFSLDMFVVGAKNISYDLCNDFTEKREQQNPSSGESVKKFDKGSYIIIDKLEETCDELTVDKEIVFVEEEPTENGTVKSSNHDNLDGFNSFECQVQNHQLSVDYLKKSFGRSYIESQSYPRKFAILNDNAYEKVIFIEVLQKHNIVCDDITWISIKHNTKYSFFKDNLSDSIIDVNALVSAAFTNNVSTTKMNSASKTRSLLHNKFKPKAVCRGMNDVFRSLFDKKESCYNCEELERYEIVCSICLSLDKSTCLKECGHYFCDTCWIEYLNSKIVVGCFKILCPQYKCMSKVDLVTVLSFVNDKNLELYTKKICEIHVLTSPGMKLCPVANCTKVATSDFSCESELDIANILLFCANIDGVSSVDFQIIGHLLVKQA